MHFIIIFALPFGGIFGIFIPIIFKSFMDVLMHEVQHNFKEVKNFVETRLFEIRR